MCKGVGIDAIKKISNNASQESTGNLRDMKYPEKPLHPHICFNCSLPWLDQRQKCHVMICISIFWALYKTTTWSYKKGHEAVRVTYAHLHECQYSLKFLIVLMLMKKQNTSQETSDLGMMIKEHTWYFSDKAAIINLSQTVEFGGYFENCSKLASHN